MAYTWVGIGRNRSKIPPGALKGGTDSDDAPLYVAKAKFEGDELPVKYIPSKNAAYVCHNGKEVTVDCDIEVMVEAKLVWKTASNGQFPQGAVSTGKTSSGDLLYIARADYEGSTTIGKLHPKHGVTYIPYNGLEVGLKNYEVLTVE